MDRHYFFSFLLSGLGTGDSGFSVQFVVVEVRRRSNRPNRLSVRVDVGVAVAALLFTCRLYLRKDKKKKQIQMTIIKHESDLDI